MCNKPIKNPYAEKVPCDACNRAISGRDIFVKLAPAEHEHGLWIRPINEGVWFDGEQFCSLECLITWLQREIKQICGVPSPETTEQV